MRARALHTAVAALLAAALPALSPPSSAADASLRFGPCATTQTFACSTLSVPLDRTGALPGTIELSIERRTSGAQTSRDAVVALAGGPGQPILPLDEFVAQAIAPALGSRDLLLFDQRGSGASDPLGCSALQAFSAASSVGQAFEQCAQEIGPARGAFTTLESVQDLEALRAAAGYERLVLFGTSYGTKVALEYAERFPQHVESLVLDSVVPVDGPEAMLIPTFQAIAPALGELCSGGACRAITANPLTDLARLASKLRRHALRGAVFDGAGHRRSTSLDDVGLLGILQAGDLNPALRALLPAAVHSALRNDPDPLLRLHLLSEGLIPNVPGAMMARGHGALASAEHPATVDEALFATTSCEETPFPWSRAASAATRTAQALAALHSQPAGAFYPFDAATSFATGLLPACARWPDASGPPPAPGPLPVVPTLILSGSQDLRTPTSAARSVAARIPGAQLEVVPFTGHSVLGADLSGCADRALSAFFAGLAVPACTGAVNRFAPTPLTPTRLAFVHPLPGLAGGPGRTLVAVLDALIDLDRQVIGATLQADQELPAGSSFGGLRGGYARLSTTAVVLRRFSFVPGVQLSGTLPIRGGELRPADIHISGSLAAPGTVRVGSSLAHVSGTLGGRHFSLAVARARLSGAGASGWPAGATLAALIARERLAAGLRGGLR